jgi:3-dehydroquinate synthase
MVGAFWQPIMVGIDTNTLGSLPRREFVSGFAEVVKYGVIERPDFFEWLEANSKSLMARDSAAMIHAITQSCATKAAVVGDDERETSGRRAILNYGHTFAHAIENTAGYGAFLHGEAVSIGMQMAALCACQRQLVDSSFVDRQTHLLHALELPTRWPKANAAAMIEAMRSDKKNEHGKMRLILPTRFGHVEFFTDVTEQEMAAAIESAR